MEEEHRGSSADLFAATASVNNSGAPAYAEIPLHEIHHDHAAAALGHKEHDSFVGRLTPRPSFMEHLACSRESQFHLDRRDSRELDRYFVGSHARPSFKKTGCTWLTFLLFSPSSMVPVIWISIRNGLSSCACMVASCRR